ncbi:unnamed protein product [Adineta ricciae]|uniref:G-protein coupled receptors family 1 profile domain-containing protein n=1 Tax=Adineta ricciae TaxID=249248 RepID=A0A816CNR4_ADIRI|nr:unnamed protein product [Adineta ricciae]
MSSNDTTSSSGIIELNQISIYLSTILGFVILYAGLFGNSFNIFLFLTLGNYKRNACSFYMLSKSFFDLGILAFGLWTALLRQGFHLDFTTQNSIWCKIRYPLIDLTGFSSLTCLCLESLDVFLSSSRSATMRMKSNVKVARVLVGGFFIVWIGHGIPYMFIQDLVQRACVGTSSIYTQYYRGYFVNLGLYVFIPVVFISIFGFLTYRNLRNITSNRNPVCALTRQMIHMTLSQIGAVLLFNGPLAIFLAYSVGTANVKQKSIFRQAREQVAQSFFGVYTYGTYSVSCKK